MSSPDPVSQAAWAAADRLCPGALLVVSTGAGMSRESGIPTFRGAEGVWREYRAEDVATPEAFQADPAVFWEFQDHLRQLVAAAAPNAGHEALAELQARLLPDREARVITQNVDRLHEDAGTREVIHLHGDIVRVVCTACDFADDWYPVPAPEHPPACRCGGLLRPDVVLFHEPLPVAALEKAWALAQACEVMLVVGTSVNVQPAASLPFAALEHGALVIEINPEPTILTEHCSHSLRGTAATVLPSFVEALSDAIVPG
jgi:NAD-dependent deacetylase